MARTTKSQVAENSKSVSVETGMEGLLSKEDLSALKEKLKAELLAELKSEISSELGEKEAIIQGEYNDDVGEITIRPDQYIKVISLCPYPLNLSTEGYGRGRIFYFKGFGEVKRIMYRYLVDIIEHHRNFLEKGYFYILNRAVIHEQGLEEEYSKLLTKEKIDAILKGNDNDAIISLFKSANNAQQDFVIQMLIDYRINGIDVDMNLWDKLNRCTEDDINEKYRSTKEYLDSLESQEK